MSPKEWVWLPTRTELGPGEELNEDKDQVLNWGLGSQELKHNLIHQDGEQMCSLKCGPHEREPFSSNLEAVPAKALYCAGKEGKRFCMEMWKWMRWPRTDDLMNLGASSACSACPSGRISALNIRTHTFLASAHVTSLSTEPWMYTME